MARCAPCFETGGMSFAAGDKHTKEIAMNTGSELTADVRPSATGSLDGNGAGDHDLDYQFGRRPNARAPFPFTPIQYARLLVMRGRVRDGRDAASAHSDTLNDQNRGAAPRDLFGFLPICREFSTQN